MASTAAIIITGSTHTIAGQAGSSDAGGPIVLVGGAGDTNQAGGNASLTGGAANGTGVAGTAALVGGASGAGATGNGGAASVTGGAANSTNGTGGAASLIGGLGTGTGAGGAITITSGAAGATGVAGVVSISVGAATAGNGAAMTLTAGNGAGGTASGGNLNLVPGTAVSTGTPGEVQVNGTSGFFEAGWTQAQAGAPTATTYTIFTANRAYRVKAVSGNASSTQACTFNIFKDTGTAAPGGGTSVLTGAVSFSGVANTRVTGTLTGTVATLTMAAGDRLSVTFAAGAGTLASMTQAIVSVMLVPA